MQRPREPDHFGPRSVPLPADSLQDAASYMLRVRKVAKSSFGPVSRSEAAWNLLLALQTMEDAQRGCHIGLAAKSADVPPTTALRALQSLCRHGLVSLRQDPSDRRATLVRMTPFGQEVMRRVFSEVIVSLRNS